jgi:type I restriction enzyme S subunit
VRLGDHARTIGGGRLKLNKSHYVPNGFPAFSAAGQDGFVDTHEYDAECVVLSSIGARCGKAFYANGKWTSLANTQLIFPTHGLLSKYLWYYANDEDRWERSGSAQPFIKPSTIQNLLVPLPSEEIQVQVVRRIDELFNELDDGETALGRARGDLEVYRRSLLKAAVAGDLTAEWRAANPPRETGAQLLARILAERRARWQAEPRNRGKRYQEPVAPAVSHLPDLPTSWTWISLHQAAFVSGGVTVDAKRKPVNPINVPYLRVANVQRGWLDLSEIKTITIEASALSDLRINQGDMLLNEGGDRDKVGRGWVFDGQVQDCIHQNHVFKARPASKSINSRFVMTYLNQFARAFFIDQGKQTTNLASISLRKICSVPIPCPPFDEASLILERYSEMAFSDEGELAFLDGFGRAGVALRQSILAAAFRGDLIS